MNLERRTLLRLTGATAAASTAGLAGCLDRIGSSDEEDEDGNNSNNNSASQRPAYADWVTFDGDDTVVYAYMANDTEDELAEYEGDDDPEDDLDNEEDGDPMLVVPLIGGLVVGLGTLTLLGTGLEDLSSDDGEFESTVDGGLWTNDAYVLLGDIDTEEVTAALTETPDDQYSFRTEYEQTTEISGYAVYQPVEDDSEDSFAAGTDFENAIAVGDDAVVLSMDSESDDPVSDIRGPIEAGQGERETAADANGEFAWLLETAGHGDLVFGGYGDIDEELEAEDEFSAEESETEFEGPGGEFDELEEATGFVSSLSIESTQVSGSFAATFDSLSDDTRTELEAIIGASASEATLEFEDSRLSASATWGAGVLE